MRLGTTEILLILVLALVVFGGGKLAGVGKALGQSIKEFKKEVKEEEPAAPEKTEDKPEDKPEKKAEAKPVKKKRFQFLRDVRSEMKRVTWPTKQDVLRWSVVVVAALVFFGVYVALLDNVVITPLLVAISGLGLGV